MRVETWRVYQIVLTGLKLFNPKPFLDLTLTSQNYAV